MRWIHIASVVTLIGGFIYARFVLAPAHRIRRPNREEQPGRRRAIRFSAASIHGDCDSADFGHLQLRY